MKIIIVFLMIISLLFLFRDTDISSAGENKRDGKSKAVTETSQKSTLNKAGEKISKVPEKAGNIFLRGFNAFGSWLDEKAGHRFETKWDSQKANQPSPNPQHQGLNKDPAQGI
ncbi:MAG: hypothetical protein KKH94_09005 [Candidatus Omnitrophica bacterium]|nr:hypothetical protein [Candidatus Omnitrophota bacterium]